MRGSRAARVTLLAVALAAAALALSAGSALGARVDIVSQQPPPPGRIPPGTTYFKTIQAAVNAATWGDWVLIEPGVYDEEVKVTPPHAGIYIRGMNRNTVILDGQHEPCTRPARRRNGIEVYKANNVWIENLTVRATSTARASTARAATRSGGTAARTRTKSARTAGTGAT